MRDFLKKIIYIFLGIVFFISLVIAILGKDSNFAIFVFSFCSWLLEVIWKIIKTQIFIILILLLQLYDFIVFILLSLLSFFEEFTNTLNFWLLLCRILNLLLSIISDLLNLVEYFFKLINQETLLGVITEKIVFNLQLLLSFSEQFIIRSVNFISNFSFTTYSFYFFLFFYFTLLLFLFFFTILNIFSSVKGIYVYVLIPLTFSWVCLTFLFKFIFFEEQTYTFILSISNIFTNYIDLSISISLNQTSYAFLYLTNSISICALIYSITYFKNEPNVDKLILLLGWFSFSMMLLVISDSIILLIIGWELIGLTSFFLINFWTNRRPTLKSAFKAFSFNKVSDFCLILFFLIVSNLFNAGTVSSIVEQTLLFNVNNYNIIVISTIFLIVASSIKSAQIFFHIWLPDSMEAPVPASALIHSATLVSAGVYLLTTFQSFLVFTKLYYLVILIGSLTAFYGGLVASSQTDCKKLLAYSTISHCGFLFVTLGLNNISLTILYLYLHGFFKALTFFCVGNIIRVSKGYQDIRRMGNLSLNLPGESLLLTFSSFNLGALPLTIGFYYKHFFQCTIANFPTLTFFVPVTFLASITGLIYTFRIIYYSMFDIIKTKRKDWNLFFNSKFDNTNYSSSTPAALISIFLLMSVSLWFYTFYLSQYIDYQITIETQNDISTITQIIPIDSNYGFYFFKPNLVLYSYFILFWVLFWTITYALILITCRAEFTNLYKRTVYTYFNLTLYALFFLFLNLNLIYFIFS